MSEFLDNLKKAANTGEFNSEAAKKIIEIDSATNVKFGNGGKIQDFEHVVDIVNKRLEVAGVKKVNKEDIPEINSEYEKEINKIKEHDKLLATIKKQIDTLNDIENMVNLSVQDMLGFVNELKEKYSKEFEEKNPIFTILFEKIDEINTKYNNL